MNTVNLLNNCNNIIELIPDMAFVKDINSNFIYCNNTYLEFIGKNKEDIVGHNNFDLLSTKDANIVTNNDKLVISKKTSLTFENKIKKGINNLYFKTTKTPLFDENNQVVAIFCIAKDITKEKQLEIINKDSNYLVEYITKEPDLYKTLHKIVDLAESKDIDTKCSILLLDESKTKLHCGAAPSLPKFYNEAIEGILIGENVGSCGAAAYHKKRIIVDDINTHENWSNYLDLTTKANLRSCWSEPIVSAHNEILGTFAMYTDSHSIPSDFELTLIEKYAQITAIAIEKELNFRKILNQEKLIIQQSKLADMGNMLGNIAHQWRQPLSVISTGATGMRVKKEYQILEDEEFYNICDTINENAQYLSQTIEDFRNFIKGDSEKKRFDLKNDTNSFIKLVDTTIKQHNIQVILNLKENIKVQGYPSELIQCFINIFNNAKDALIMNKEEDDRYIFISHSVDKTHIKISFKDNAGGIPEDIIDRIFEPYFTTKHKFQGTGLGLHMSYNLITNAMKGNIQVNNENFIFNNKSYKGAKFIITLPLE